MRVNGLLPGRSQAVYSIIENLVLPPGCKPYGQEAGPPARRPYGSESQVRDNLLEADHNQMSWGIGKLE